MTDDTLDLDAARGERLKARAARHEGRADTKPIRFGGKVIATLDAEFPISVLEPLTGVNVDIAYLLRAATQMTAADKSQQAVGLDLMITALAANPQLPREIIEAVKEIGRRILGAEGYEAFCAEQPSPWDIAALTNGCLAWWGVGLGESQPSLPSSDGGETSKQTSNGNTSLTPAASGKRRGKPAS